jgi:hypothetical protein
MKGLIYVLVGGVHVAWKITRIGFRTIGGIDASSHAFIIFKGTMVRKDLNGHICDLLQSLFQH